MNDKEAHTTDTSPGNAASQASLVSGQNPASGHEGVSVAEVLITTPADAVAEPAAESPTESAIDAQSGSSAESAAEPAVESEASMPDTGWLSPDALPGEVLAARREDLRWSLKEAATRLKLTPRQVGALEANDFASLPGMASVRGFVRAYAKALGLDPEPLLEMLAREPNPAHGPMVLRRPLPTKGFPGRPSAPPPRKSKWRKRIALAVVFLAAGFAAGFEAYRSQWVELPPLDELTVDIALPDPGSIFGRWAGASSDAGTGQAEPASDQVAEAETAADKVQAAPPPVAAPALQLKLSEDAWVEITTVSGHRIVSELIKGGSSASFDIPEPSVLVVGNASAVEARLRGQLLNLKAVARDNVSKLSIK